MAQYKVPQDVEADDKLLGPFNFRQFVYLLVAGGLIALAVAFFQIFPLLAIIPLPFVLLLGALALPLKKDQPMETYLAAIVSFYLKPRTRRWMTGQQDTAIEIIAPKKKPEEESRIRDITGEEATHRLSFLADIVDTEGYAIKGLGAKRVNDDLILEANNTSDMFETNHFQNLENTIARDENEQRAKVMQEMREEIAKVEQVGGATIQGGSNGSVAGSEIVSAGFNGGMENVQPISSNRVEMEKPQNQMSNGGQMKAKPSIIELANNPDFSIATISKEANRLKERDEGEVFVSLH
ncbi:PrgI family protein [Candidatus Saccharibacteria bacterium]|nr:PrgI family protein [Candidatus Saccharibacteria bacterium]